MDMMAIPGQGQVLPDGLCGIRGRGQSNLAIRPQQFLGRCRRAIWHCAQGNRPQPVDVCPVTQS